MTILQLNKNHNLSKFKKTYVNLHNECVDNLSLDTLASAEVVNCLINFTNKTCKIKLNLM